MLWAWRQRQAQGLTGPSGPRETPRSPFRGQAAGVAQDNLQAWVVFATVAFKIRALLLLCGSTSASDREPRPRHSEAAPGPSGPPVEFRRVCEQRRPAVSCLVLAPRISLVLPSWLGPPRKASLPLESLFKIWKVLNLKV